MAKVVRQSKFRHVYGKPKKREECYDDVKVTANSHDSVYCSINPKFLAVVTESGGGGMFIVVPMGKVYQSDPITDTCQNSSKHCIHVGF